jgi:glucan phosphoethanolaminetransferase (alkaline phosphatase superfamily)
MDIHTKYLIFSSALMLLIGLLAGAPYGNAINRDAPAHIVNAWRVAHASLPMGAALGLAMAVILSSLSVGWWCKALIVWPFILASAGFTFALLYGAMVGQRGLQRRAPFTNQLVYTGNIIGAAGSLISAIVLLYAAFVSLF